MNVFSLNMVDDAVLRIIAKYWINKHFQSNILSPRVYRNFFKNTGLGLREVAKVILFILII